VLNLVELLLTNTSFLENPKNTDLIRWADDGKSFVVLNEDDFANKLIPELFKHNNYASFVRQLNMYGFHKKVGLSDNSMRASERKAKSPSEYFNPYFRQGYPDLLWLIQKPKNQPTVQKKQPRGKSEEREEDEDFVVEDSNSADITRPRPPLAIGQGDRPLSTEQMQNIQRELSVIRRNQTQITQMLGQVKREHDALVEQANDYQEKFSRHEHSINAILTFLATLYNRSLQNHDGGQDIAEIFASTLASDKNGNGGVVDVDNFVYNVPEGSIDQGYHPAKRQRLMITDGTNNRASTISPSSTNSPLPRPSRRPSHMARSPQSAHVEEIVDSDNNQVGEQNYYPSTGRQQQDDMMSLIHTTNAQNSGRNTPIPDFSHVLNDLEITGGTTPVNSSQRDNMLRMLNAQAQGSKRPQSSGNNGALVSPSRTNAQQAHFDQRINASRRDLEHLAHLQAAQDKSVENLTSLLQPLSPSGSIPGLGDGQDVPPPPLNIDDFLGSHDYFGNIQDDGNGDYDFSTLNNAAYSQNMNGNNGGTGFDFADDAPLFADVDANEVEDDNFLSAGTYNGMDDGKRRIESVASSSEAPTPRKAVSEDGESTTAKGRRGS